MKIKPILLITTCLAMLIYNSCEIIDDEDVEDEENNSASEKPEEQIIGTWYFEGVYDISSSKIEANGVVYTFNENGTVLYGNTFNNSAYNSMYQELADVRTDYEIKYFFESDWSINNETLYISGDVINYSINLSDSTIEGLELLKSGFLDQNDKTSTGYFTKKEDLSEYDNIIDLSDFTLSINSLDGIWIDVSTDETAAYELSNGVSKTNYLYLDGVFTDVSEDYPPSYHNYSFSFGDQDYDKQQRGRAFHFKGINVLGDKFDTEYTVIDYGVDENGSLNFVRYFKRDSYRNYLAKYQD